MKRVHEWEVPETTGYDAHDRNGHNEPTKRRKSGHSHSVAMKRSTSSQAKAQAAIYAHGSRHAMSLSKYPAEAEKHLQTNVMAYPMQFNDVHFSQVSPYQPQSGASDPYSHSYLVAY